METILNHNNKNYKLDTNLNRITFLDQRFYFTEDGKAVPSVTTILEAYPKGAAFYEWLKKNGQDSDDIRDEAGRRGSRVHALTESYDKGEEVTLLDGDGEINMSMLEWAMFERYCEFSTRFKPVNKLIEGTFVNGELGYAGTLDRIIELDGRTILMDIKTSNAVHPSYFLQLAAYEQLLTKHHGYNPIDATAVLWLNAKTRTEGKKDQIQGKGWQLVFGDDQKDYLKIFNNVHALWLEENGSVAPRQVSYSLTYKK